MFKPLLKTMPTLSGNVKIACDLTDYNKINDNTYECYVRNARLCPISADLMHKQIPVNLLNSKYEYDIAKYYTYYQDIFYQSIFSFNKYDYVKIDYTTEPKPRDNDFDFGCKRLSYQKYGEQFGFFAPIYIDDVDDIPNMFQIIVEITTDSYVITKYININIANNTDNKYNYLYKYINKYVSKIDSNVIYCLPDSTQMMYYGINVTSGGFTKIADNVSVKLFKAQQTLNNFDALITYGFKRNHIIIRQILPFAFYFNLNDILTTYEKYLYRNCKLKITGKWFKNSIEQSLYTFSDDYTMYKQSILTLNNYGNLKYVEGTYNIMDCVFPALNEVRYFNYRYTNKLTKNYFRWKLKYSDDEHPYITNINWAFSNNQNSSCRYGEFPGKYLNIPGFVNDNNDIHNLVLPINDSAVELYNDRGYYEAAKEYKNQLNSFVSNWFQSINEISDIYSDSVEWSNVVDNKSYHKGILYNFNNIYNNCVLDETPQIDKFAVFVKLNTNIITSDNVSSYIYTNVTAMTSKDTIKTYNISKNTNFVTKTLTSENINEHNVVNTIFNLDNTTYTQSITNDSIFINNGQLSQGRFIDPLDYGLDYYDLNKYYSINDLLALNDKTISKMFNYKYLNILKNQLNCDIIDGYEILPVNTFSKLINYKETNTNMLKSSYAYLFAIQADDITDITKSNYNLFKSLYLSTNDDTDIKTKYSDNLVTTFVSENKNIVDMYNIQLYNRQDFIGYDSLCKLITVSGVSYDYVNNILNNAVQYEYIPQYIKDNQVIANNVFIKVNRTANKFYGTYIPKDKASIDNQVIYFDPYNINNIVDHYNNTNKYVDNVFSYYYEKTESKKYSGKYIELTNDNSTEFFAKILDTTFLMRYISTIYNNADNTLNNELYSENNEPLYNVLNTIFIKQRYIISKNANTSLENTDAVYLKDVYIPLSSIFTDTYKLSETVNVIRKCINEINNKNSSKYYKAYWKFKYENMSEIVINNIKNLGLYNDEGFELYYKKRFVKLDTNLFDIIHVIDTDIDLLNYKDIYLYINYNADLENPYTKIYYVHDNNFNETLGKLQSTTYNYNIGDCNANLTYNSYISDIDMALLPLFDNTMLQSKNNSKFYNYYTLNDISKCYVMDNNVITYTFYRYDSNDKQFLIDISDKYISSNNYKLDQLYTINGNNYCSYDFAYTYFKNKNIEWVPSYDTNHNIYVNYNNTAYTILSTYSIFRQTPPYVGDPNPSHVNSYMFGYELYINGNMNCHKMQVSYSYEYSYSYVYSYEVAYTYLYKSGNSDELTKTTTYLTKYGINTKNITAKGYKDEIYGYYILNLDLTNTSSMFNFVGDNERNIKYVTYINNKDISLKPDDNSSFDGEEYLTSIFKYIVPFLKIPLFDIYSNYVNTITVPMKFYLDNHYKQTKLAYTSLYGILYNENKINQTTLTRYLDNIVPYLYPTKILANTYTLKYKNYDGTPDIDNYDTVIDKHDYNIYDYQPVNVYDKSGNIINTWEPLEHKYYNDNVFVNLEEEFSIKAHTNIIYSELLKYEESNESFELFKAHINSKHMYNNDEILFLYNKYDVKYDTISTGLNSSLSEVVYTLIYKFILF